MSMQFQFDHIHTPCARVWQIHNVLGSLDSADALLTHCEQLPYTLRQQLDNPTFTYEWEQCTDVNHPVCDLIESDQFVNACVEITHCAVTRVLSVWASRYSQGHYLTAHGDGVSQRKLAFLLYLNRGWQPEWGGALCVQQPNHDAWCMMPPQHGTLILMDVTQNSLQHMVTQVTHAHDRYALAGWLA